MDGVLKSVPNPELAGPGRRRWKWWWLPMIGLAVVAAAGLAYYLISAKIMGRSGTIAAADMVYADPMWAMHVGMQGMSGMMAGSNPTQAGSPATGTPLADMDVRFFDFGSLSGSQEVSHSFILANRGDAPLMVTHAYATCGCTSAMISAAVIPPGKAGLVTVYFSPMMSAGGSEAIRRGIILETNDPLQPEIEIWVQAALEQ